MKRQQGHKHEDDSARQWDSSSVEKTARVTTGERIKTICFSRDTLNAAYLIVLATSCVSEPPPPSNSSRGFDRHIPML